jgi:hypothetical protein
LFAEDDRRSIPSNKPEPLGPEMSRIVKAETLPRDREPLTGRGAGPDGVIVTPASTSKCVAPDSNPGEEMTLRESEEVGRFDFDN